MYNASPNDTLMSVGDPTDPTIWSGGTGKYVAIIGQNLKNAVSIKFDGVDATFNNALFGPNSVVVPIPNIVFSAIDTTKLYTIEYVTTTGSTTFSFKLGPPAPKISAISDVFANPGDSVYVYGTNLVLVQNFSYGGTAITSYTTNAYGTAIGFVMPNPALMSGLVSVTTKTSTATFKIAAIPTITAISNGNANVGDSVYVYGTYLKTIQSVSFGGATITDFTEDPHGYYVKFLAPASNSYSSGPVTIVTGFGTAATAYKINTQNDKWLGLLANFEWGDYFGYAWWGDIKLASNMADFNGLMGTNSSQYVYFNSPVLDGGKSVYAPLGNANDTPINKKNTWMPVENLTDTVSHWALQFEISVAHPWNGGTLYIRTEFAGDTYVARYEPWKIPGSNKTHAFITKGWQTVTIPLSEFRSKVKELGDGESVPSLNLLIGPTGENSYNMTLKNFGTSSTATGLYAAIDNIRCVKIK